MPANMYCKWTVVLMMFVAGSAYFLEYRDWVDWNKTGVQRVSPGHCTTVIEGGGSEDILRLGNNKLLITQGFNFAFTPGQFTVLDMNTYMTTKVNITNAPQRADFLGGLHGITSWRDNETDQLFIYAVTHAASEDRVEVLEMSQNLTLTYVKTITDPSFTMMNALVAVDKDKFYITSCMKYRTLSYITAENWLRLRNGRIVYYDGRKGREVATGYFLANGINMSPDMKTIYMAEFGYKKLHAFTRDESNNLQHLWEYTTQSMLDNIDIEPSTGHLWIGSHPVAWRILDFNQVFGRGNLPSLVIRIKLRDNMVSEVEEIFSNNGDLISGSTVGVYVNGKLVIGSLASSTLICDVKYLSP